MKCKVCKFESSSLEEVSYYDINGNSVTDEREVERNAQNPDALAHELCSDCAENFDFKNGSPMVLHIECGNRFSFSEVKDIRRTSYEGMDITVFACPVCKRETSDLDCAQ